MQSSGHTPPIFFASQIIDIYGYKGPISNPHNSCSVVCVQCDQIGRLLKVLGIKFAYESGQMIGDFLGYFEKNINVGMVI